MSVRVRPDPAFVRQGDDLFHRTPVSIVQAALGTKLTLETFDGEQPIEVQARHPARRVASGCAASGFPRCAPDGAAISICEIAVEVPRSLTEEEAELLAQFAALRGETVDPPREGLFSRIRSAFQ